MELLEVLIPFVGVLLIVAAIAVFVIRADRRRRAALRALAERRGWQIGFAERNTEGAIGTVLRPAAADPESWELSQVSRSRRNSASRSGGTVTRSRWIDPGRRSPAGLWAFAPPLPAEAAAAGMGLLGALGGGMARAMLTRFLGDIGRELPDLQHVEAPGGKPRGFTLFTSAPDAEGVDLDLIDAAFRDWTARHPGGKPPPVLLAEPGRLSLRLETSLNQAADWEEMADFGRRIAPAFPLNHPDL